MKRSLSLNILRVSLLLVLLGFFLPVACDLNGRQIAQGILGEPQQAGNGWLLGAIENAYGYFMYAVFGCAAIGLLLTFIPGIKSVYFRSFLFLVASFLFFTVVLLKFLAIRNGIILGFLVTTFNIRVKVLIGGYFMAGGYLTALIGFISKVILKRR